MSLLVWLPLNGNLENQGLSNVTVTNNGATVDNNGKIGKCYKFNANYITVPTISLPENFSIAIWGRWDALSLWSRLLDFGSAAGSAGYGFLLANSSTTNQLIFGYKCGSNSSVNNNFGTITIGEWYHITLTFEGVNIKVYLNGNLIKNITSANSIGGHTFNYNYLGKSNWSSDSLFTGALNDFRIYDHTLSAKEVKDLAKGLVLHYRLTGPGRPNLLSYQKIVKQSNVSFSYDPNTLTFTTKTPTTATCYGIRMNTDNCIIPWNHVGIMSMDILSPVATTFYRDDNDYAVSGNSWSGNDNTTRGSIVTAIPANKWTKIIIYSINNSSLNTNHESVKVQSSFNINTANVEFKFKNVKFEVSPISTDRNVTPWCPASDDPLYMALGYNNNIEYDCSGYRRNGIKKSNIAWDINSARYTTSYKFDGSTAGIEVTATGLGNIMNNPCTIAFWLYSNDKGGRSIYFSSYNSNPFWCIEKAADERFRYDWNNSPDKYSTGIIIPDKKWTHICFVREGVSLAKLYLNGELKYSFTDATSSLSLSDTWRIGRDIRTGDGTPLNGNMSDFRIYATALSEADIQELYHSAVIVDNTGKNYAYEYFEA